MLSGRAVPGASDGRYRLVPDSAAAILRPVLSRGCSEPPPRSPNHGNATYKQGSLGDPA